ncbi:hypothetical protein MNBD_GAMMA15-1018 [hydrothermal vent metagenome]|uniref:Uncharacterized protein n=1 Tax=hydrothermal vent metagenome TaxID=652676 RepID=A0A3B0YN91_9ZZZZ
MEEQPLKLDDEGIPILEHPVDLNAFSDQPLVTGPDLTDHEIVEQLLGKDRISELINDLTDDLQKMVSWKIEEVLKEELAKLIHDATEQSSAKLSEDIRTQLQLALPELVVKIAKEKTS